MIKPKISLRHVYKEYSLYKSNKDKLLEFVLNKRNSTIFYAIKDVSFDVFPGETIGVVGINGSGKSTLSNILAEVIPPTSGELIINGETSLIAISAGLNGQLSGIENIYLKCMMHGMSDIEIEKVKKDIIEFADIGSFINQPVKNYSSGMKSRLGFAISVHTNPDILIIDEALSVGDQTFYDKCIKKIEEFKTDGKTIFFISHSISQVQKIADRVIWMHYGEVKEFDDKDTVLSNYGEFISWFNHLSEEEKIKYKDQMFSRQIPTEQDKINMGKLRRNRRKKDKNKRLTFNLQFTIMVLLSMILSVFIVSGISLGQAWNKMIEIGDFSMEEKEVPIDENIVEHQDEIKLVNKEGFVHKSIIPIYREKELSIVQTELPLFTKVHVVEAINNTVYKINFDDTEGYVSLNDINIDQELLISELTIEDFLPLLSEVFNESYLYFLSFLSVSVIDFQEKLQDSANVEILDSSVVFQIEHGEITYYSFDGETVEQLELKIKNSISDELLERLDKEGLKHIDEPIYYLETENYKYEVDFVKKIIKLTSSS